MDKYNNFHFEYFHNATLVGELQVPLLKATEAIPRNVFSYSEIESVKNTNECCIDFFVDDYRFEKLKFLPYFNILKKTKDILPNIKEILFCIKIIEISKLYNQLDKIIKKINCFKSRTVAYYMQHEGINIIPTVAWANEEDFSYCFDGIPKNSSVAISSNGCKSNEYSKNMFLSGVKELQNILKPKHLIICGEPFFELQKYDNIISYPSFSMRRKRRQQEAQMKRDGQLNFDFIEKYISIEKLNSI